MPTLHHQVGPAEQPGWVETIFLIGTCGSFALAAMVWFGPGLVFRGLRRLAQPALLTTLVFMT